MTFKRIHNFPFLVEKKKWKTPFNRYQYKLIDGVLCQRTIKIKMLGVRIQQSCN